MKKRLKQYILCSLGAGAFLMFGASVQAAFFSIDLIDGDWAGGVPTSNVTYNNSLGTDGTSIATWGPSIGDQSGYDFTTETLPAFNVESNGLPFLLGNFTHNNFPIPRGTSITSIDLDLDVQSFGAFNVTGIFNFGHEETTNTNDPDASRDIVTITNPNADQPFSF
jgi:hypothetical protein